MREMSLKERSALVLPLTIIVLAWVPPSLETVAFTVGLLLIAFHP